MKTPAIRLLLIEDSTVDKAVISAYLQQSKVVPIEVECAASLAAAQQCLERAPFDVVLLDLNLPDSRGLATFHQFHDAHPRQPTVVLTGMQAEGLAMEAVHAGADDYLAKQGLEPQSLIRAVCYAVERERHRQSEDLLHDEEARYRALFEQSPDCIMLIDPQTTLAVDFNDAMCHLLGYTRSEFQSLPIAAYEAVENAAQIATHIHTLMVQGGSTFETRFRAKDGGLRDMIVTVQPLTLGGRVLLHAISRDITDLKRTERSLRQSEQRYRELLAAVTSYTYTVKFDNVTPAATEHSWGCLAATGYTPADFANDSYLWFKMIHPDDREFVHERVTAIRACPSVPPFEHRILHRDGTTRWVRSTIVRHCDATGHLLRYDGLIEDITDRKQAEQVLRDKDSQILAAQKMQQRLLPAAAWAVPGLEIGGASLAAAFVGGDYYDYFSLCDGTTGFVIGDVSGHGLGASLVMALTHAHLRALAHHSPDLAEILAGTNRFLAAETDRFVTLFLGRLDLPSRRLWYINAGHPAGCLFDARGNLKARLESTTLPLAVLADTDFSAVQSLTVAPGDVLLLLTDGILEARTASDEAFGEARAVDVVRGWRDHAAQEIAEQLCHAACKFSQRDSPSDDVTALVVKLPA